jgi:hypothetical protein
MVSRNPNHSEFQFPERHFVAAHFKAAVQVKNKTDIILTTENSNESKSI